MKKCEGFIGPNALQGPQGCCGYAPCDATGTGIGAGATTGPTTRHKNIGLLTKAEGEQIKVRLKAERGEGGSRGGGGCSGCCLSGEGVGDDNPGDDSRRRRGAASPSPCSTSTSASSPTRVTSTAGTSGRGGRGHRHCGREHAGDHSPPGKTHTRVSQAVLQGEVGLGEGMQVIDITRQGGGTTCNSSSGSGGGGGKGGGGGGGFREHQQCPIPHPSQGQSLKGTLLSGALEHMPPTPTPACVYGTPCTPCHRSPCGIRGHGEQREGCTYGGVVGGGRDEAPRGTVILGLLLLLLLLILLGTAATFTVGNQGGGSSSTCTTTTPPCDRCRCCHHHTVQSECKHRGCPTAIPTDAVDESAAATGK